MFRKNALLGFENLGHLVLLVVQLHYVLVTEAERPLEDYVALDVVGVAKNSFNFDQFSWYACLVEIIDWVLVVEVSDRSPRYHHGGHRCGPVPLLSNQLLGADVALEVISKIPVWLG